MRRMNGMNGLDGMNDIATMITSMVDSATKSFATVYPMVTGKQGQITPAPAPTSSSADTTSKYLLYGGLAIGAIALVMMLKKRK